MSDRSLGRDADEPPRQLALGCRSVYGAPPPRRIVLEVPGWAGSAVRRSDGASAQPWHCRPFADGATYGMELVYPYGTECRVTNDGVVHFDGALDAEMAAAGGLPHPFGAFAAGHYGMATALDLLPPPGYALRLEPHPRFFTSAIDDVPLAVPGHLRRFWPRQFFAVFRAPVIGAAHVFRPGEPYAQLLLVPETQSYDVQSMAPAIATDRAQQDSQITTLGYLLAKRLWRADSGRWFDDKYKQLLRLFQRGGVDAVRNRLQSVDDQVTRRTRGRED